MQFNHSIVILIVISIICVTLVDSRTKRSKKSKIRADNANSTQINTTDKLSNNTNTATESSKDQTKPKKDKKPKFDSNNLYSHIILSRLYAFENRLQPLLVKYGIFEDDKSNKTIENSQILGELHRELTKSIKKEDAKKARDAFNKSIKDLFLELKNQGEFTAKDGVFTYKLKNPITEPATDGQDATKNDDKDKLIPPIPSLIEPLSTSGSQSAPGETKKSGDSPILSQIAPLASEPIPAIPVIPSLVAPLDKTVQNASSGVMPGQAQSTNIPLPGVVPSLVAPIAIPSGSSPTPNIIVPNNNAAVVISSTISNVSIPNLIPQNNQPGVVPSNAAPLTGVNPNFLGNNSPSASAPAAPASPVVPLPSQVQAISPAAPAEVKINGSSTSPSSQDPKKSDGGFLSNIKNTVANIIDSAEHLLGFR
jgi:hypothetical protein